jgi:hypothetical protein
MDNLQILQNFLPRLNSLIKSELRIKGSSKFVKSTYICGFSSADNISISIYEYPPGVTTFRSPGDFYFKIEYLQQTILEKNCLPTDETLNAFLYILEDLINSSQRLKRQAQSFPNLTEEDNRDVKLKKLFEKNTYIPLVP